jgi:hypothetical protein
MLRVLRDSPDGASKDGALGYNFVTVSHRELGSFSTHTGRSKTINLNSGRKRYQGLGLTYVPQLFLYLS